MIQEKKELFLKRKIAYQNSKPCQILHKVYKWLIIGIISLSALCYAYTVAYAEYVQFRINREIKIVSTQIAYNNEEIQKIEEIKNKLIATQNSLNCKINILTTENRLIRDSECLVFTKPL